MGQAQHSATDRSVRKGVQSSASKTGCLRPRQKMHFRLETRRCRADWSLAVRHTWIQVGVSVTGIAVAVGMEARCAKIDIAVLRADGDA